MRSDEYEGNKLSLLKDNLENSLGYKILTDLFDTGTFYQLNPYFRYNEIDSGIICGSGTINGKSAYAFSQSVDINGAAMSKSQADKLCKLYSMALKSGSPVVGIYDSKGAVLTEENEVLASYGEVLKKCSELIGVVPQISVITGMCFGAMSVIAGCADVIIMVRESEFGIDIGGRNSNADHAVRSGDVHIVAENKSQAIEYARRLIGLLPENNLCPNSFVDNEDETWENTDSFNEQHNAIENVCDKGSFIELRKGFGSEFIIGFATIKGGLVGVIASNPRNSEVGFDACSKVSGFVMFCDSYSVPIITFIDSCEVASASGASKLVCAYSNATTSKVAVITGKVYGTLYTALCGKDIQDIVFCWEKSEISMLPPETAVEILWKDKLHSDGTNFRKHRENIVDQYKSEKASSLLAGKIGLVDDVFTPQETRDKLCFALRMLSSKRQRGLPKKHGNIKI